jgi:hypothetical protein
VRRAEGVAPVEVGGWGWAGLDAGASDVGVNVNVE